MKPIASQSKKKLRKAVIQKRSRELISMLTWMKMRKPRKKESSGLLVNSISKEMQGQRAGERM